MVVNGVIIKKKLKSAILLLGWRFFIDKKIMKVLKFGGSSLANKPAIEQVGKIIQSNDGQLLVVVSAMGGVTDRLHEIADEALSNPENCKLKIQSLVTSHFQILAELVGSDQSAKIQDIGHQLNQICMGVGLTKERTLRTLDLILSSGERFSAAIVTAYLEKLSVDVKLWESNEIIITNNDFGCARVDLERSKSKIPSKPELRQVNVFPGFIGGTVEGQITTLGRGGSDYSAAILANLFDAEVLEIWTDVDGIRTADPRLVKRSKLIEQLSYEEASELSHFGAKVIYKPSLNPVLKKQIPTKIKNTFNPDGAGTLISNVTQAELISGISSISSISLITISGRLISDVPQFTSDLFGTIAQANVKAVFITQSSSDNSITLGFHSKEAEIVKKHLSEKLKSELADGAIDPVVVDKDFSLLALIGSNMQNQVGISGKMFNILGKNGVSIKAIAQGSSERNISAIISQKDLNKSVNLLHEGFFLSESKRVNLFIIGTGNVGKAFLNQLSKQFTYLKKHHHLNVKAIGISNSRKMCFETDGIPLSKWSQRIEMGEQYDSESFFSHMFSLNLRNCIFIDITGSEMISKTYSEVLKRSISVVTPNKIAATGSMENYLELKRIARTFRSQFLFETNVCAGLPVLSTLNDLIRSGDKIHHIEAVLSGTLNFIFNEYNGSSSFASVIKKAKELGYSEPDPRLDLSGMDVMRKLLILVRESGFEMEMDQIEMQTFLPESCVDNADLDTFYTEVEKAESYFKTLYENAARQKHRLKMVAIYENGKAKVKLSEVADDHPFFNLEGKDNIVLFYTDRYKEQPLVIKGAGAGAEVTASGIFADVLRVSQTD
jgi:bifunctional aspartokinase / homoserine dehydrogenase 1